MDKFIDWFSGQSVTRQILVTLGICAFLLFLIGASYVLTSPVPNKPANTISDEKNSSPSESNTPNSPTQTKETYSSDTYQLSYPSNLNGGSGVISGGGTAFSLSGKEDLTNYTIQLQLTDLAQTPVSNMYSIFRAFGFKEEEVTLKNVTAKKFYGATGDITETAIIFENRGKAYKIQLIYSGTTRNSKIDKIFEEIISSFILI
mgnify:CR=1 FL=1